MVVSQRLGAMGRKEEARVILQNFSRTTSSHGLPQVGYSRTIKHKLFWVIIFCIGLVVFLTQATSLIRKYARGDKTVSVELRFEAAVFPAVTICNLNPYKNSLVQRVESVQRTLNVFDHVKKISKGQQGTESPLRRRKAGDVGYQPILAFCDCGHNINDECRPITNPIGPFGTRCVCFRDMEYKTLESCFNEKLWTTVLCYDCSYTGRCKRPEQIAHDRGRQCMCPATSTYCVVKPDVVPVIGNPAWFTTTTTTTTTTTPTTPTTTTSTTTTSTTTSTSTTTTSTTTSTTTTTPTTTAYTGPTTIGYEDVQALGYEGMTDEVAIVTKAKENVVFIVATLDMQTRINLSYTKSDLIKMCSFNGKQCDIENDFILHLDPIYGNCYTYNFIQESNRTSSRAGPMYGLRVLVYSNVSDYMPTTESAGVRIQIHGRNDQPFPDTFGQNAPTGFISSFGIQLKEITRSPKFGDCSTEGRTEQYIYTNRTYSTEGCYRSCFQHFLLKTCHCADPRFPKPDGDCLNTRTEEVGGFYGVQSGCICRQPCEQSGYSVSYSAAKWPADYFQMGDCGNDSQSCVDEYRNHAALLEIYYEQLNYESLEEFEAYGLVNLVADFGGQLGLWLGFSFITLVEIFMLTYDLISLMLGHRTDRVQWATDSMSSVRDEEKHHQRRHCAPMLDTSRDISSLRMAVRNGEYCNCHHGDTKVLPSLCLHSEEHSPSVTSLCDVEISSELQ